MMLLCAAWRNTSVRRMTGTAPDVMTSVSTWPGRTEGSWSMSPTISSAGRSEPAFNKGRRPSRSRRRPGGRNRADYRRLIRAVIALLFVVPAGVAGYHSLGLARLAVRAELWQQSVSLIGRLGGGRHGLGASGIIDATRYRNGRSHWMPTAALRSVRLQRQLGAGDTHR